MRAAVALLASAITIAAGYATGDELWSKIALYAAGGVLVAVWGWMKGKGE